MLLATVACRKTITMQARSSGYEVMQVQDDGKNCCFVLGLNSDLIQDDYLKKAAMVSFGRTVASAGVGGYSGA